MPAPVEASDANLFWRTWEVLGLADEEEQDDASCSSAICLEQRRQQRLSIQLKSTWSAYFLHMKSPANEATSRDQLDVSAVPDAFEDPACK
jgi:hypothetical protein